MYKNYFKEDRNPNQNYKLFFSIVLARLFKKNCDYYRLIGSDILKNCCDYLFIEKKYFLIT